jgi:hypothetical protein
MASEDIIKKATGGPMGFSGPVSLKEVRIIADNSIKGMANFVTGGNEKDVHLTGVNVDRDFKVSRYADIIQIGTRNMQNFRLLTEVGNVDKPVILKRGMSATIKEFLRSAEYIAAQGNENVALRPLPGAAAPTGYGWGLVIGVNACQDPALSGFSHLE